MYDLPYFALNFVFFIKLVIFSYLFFENHYFVVLYYKIIKNSTYYSYYLFIVHMKNPDFNSDLFSKKYYFFKK